MTETTALPSTDSREGREVPDLIASLPPEALSATLSRLSAFYKRFLYHPSESTYDLCVLWAAHTHGLATWRATPRLYIVAPERDCGKTTQAELLSFASHAGILAGTTSTAGLFTIVNTRTVFLDETDNLFSSHSERKVLTSVLNSGYTPDGHVLRKTGPIPVYGALAFAGIEDGRMPEPTRQRCIPVQMRNGKPAEFWDPYDYIAYGDEVRARLAHAADSWVYVKPSEVTRNNQIWAPLHSIAAAAGGDWPERARKAQQDHQWRTEASEQKAVLAATREWFDQHPKEQRVTSAALAEYISADDRLPQTSPKALAGRMKGYGVEPHKISHMYYLRSDLEPVWAEWLPKAS